MQIFPHEEQIAVQAGDVIGIHYEMANRIEESGVIPYADSRDGICCGLSWSGLSKFASGFKADNDFPISDIYKFVPRPNPIYRTPALVVLIDPQ